jgi:4-diphosphocytidyl-2-C-methyl-D-erythritol kinase
MIYRACAKVNIFLKIVGTRGNYHELASRFVRIPTLYDEIHVTKKSKASEGLLLQGDFGCEAKDNTITKAYEVLKASGFEAPLEVFFREHALHVIKHIPKGAGLGGGSSDAAAFMRLCNEVLSLGLSTEALAALALKVGADVPFFIYGYESANVQGVGEIITPFDEPLPALELFTPPLFCDTGAVYGAFRKTWLAYIDVELAKQMLTCKSDTLMQVYSTETLNDLFAPAVSLYPALAAYVKSGWMMSGSGSTLFRINHG